MKLDSLHYALLAVVVLLAVYCGASFFREASTSDSPLGQLQQAETKRVRLNTLPPEQIAETISGMQENSLIITRAGKVKKRYSNVRYPLIRAGLGTAEDKDIRQSR